MALPSLAHGYSDEQRVKPRILVLEVRPRGRPDGEPVAFVLIEREETYQCDPKDGRIYEATIRLFYQPITAKGERQPSARCFFEGSYSCFSQSVSITGSVVFLDPEELRGYRIGTYLMSQIVSWVQRWPDAEVRDVELMIGQADDENKLRRNRFYEQFGLVFDYSDGENKLGRSRPMLARQLTPVDTWQKNITERLVTDYLADLLQSQARTVMALRQRTQVVELLAAKQQRIEAHPMHWFLRKLYHQYVGIVVSATVIGVLGVLVAFTWFK